MGLETVLYSLMGFEEAPSFLTKVLIFVGSLFVVLSLYITKNYVHQQLKLRKFRGPFAIPLLGNCYSPAVVMSLFKFLSHCRKNYGKVFRVFLFHTPFVVVCDPAIVRRILSDTRTFPKGEKYTKIFGIVFGGGLVTSNAEKHKADRALFNKYFIRSSVSSLIPSMNRHVLRGIEEFISSSITDGEEKKFDCEKIFSRLSLRVFLNFAFDFDLSDQTENESKVCNFVSSASCQVGNMIAFNTPDWNIIPSVRHIKTLPPFIMSYCQPIIDARREQFANGTLLPEDKEDPLTMMVSNKKKCKHRRA